jgi:uncharacterized GH25 family protein
MAEKTAKGMKRVSRDIGNMAIFCFENDRRVKKMSKKMRSRKISIAAVFLFVFALMAACSAEAHFLSVITDSSTVAVGESYQVNLSFTHVLPKMAQFGAQTPEIAATDIVFGAKFLYKDGTSTSFPAFSEGETMNFSSARVEKAGTVLLSTKCSLTMFGGGGPIPPIPAEAFSKQILNAESDGWSTHVVGEKMEIVPQSDIADAKVGDTIKFKVILNGASLAGATVEWADPASPLYEDPEEGGDANLQELSDLTGSDGTFSYTITHAGLNALAVTPPEGDSGTSYICSLIFNAKNAVVDSSGGGCNAGFGASLTAGLSLFVASFLRGKRG